MRRPTRSEHGIGRAHGSYEELLADDELDAVYISLPNGMHHEWTLKAIDAGKHVLVEKPYSRRAAEAEEAWDAAGRAGVIVMEAFMWRHHPQAAAALSLVEQGKIGRLREIRTTFSFPLFDHENVRMVGRPRRRRADGRRLLLHQRRAAAGRRA